MKHSGLLLLTLLFLAGCDADPASSAKRTPASRAVLVKTLQIESRDTERQIERNGTLKALREVAIAAQQEGVLLSLPHHEGDQVEQGELLLELDSTQTMA